MEEENNAHVWLLDEKGNAVIEMDLFIPENLDRTQMIVIRVDQQIVMFEKRALCNGVI